MFRTGSDFNYFDKIIFERKKLMTYAFFRSKWCSTLKSKHSVELKSSKTRVVVENKKFWHSVGNLIQSSEKLKNLLYHVFVLLDFRFSDDIYTGHGTLFEEEVLKKISKDISIGIKDLLPTKEKELWLQKYNIQYYFSVHSSLLHHFSTARNLKVIELWQFPSFDERDMNVFLQLKTLHSLKIWFKRGLE